MRALTIGKLAEATGVNLETVRYYEGIGSRLERMLADMAAQCHGGQVPECPIIDALFAAHSHPRRKRGLVLV